MNTKTGKATEVSKPKFTPGPWEVIHDNCVVNSKDKNSMKPAFFCQVQRVGSDNYEANAHLIASAPLMYSILKRIQKDGFESIGDVEIEDALIQAEGRA